MAKSIFVIGPGELRELPMRFDDYQSEVRIRMEQDIIPNLFFGDPDWFISELETNKNYLYRLVQTGYWMAGMEMYYEKKDFSVKKMIWPGGEVVYSIKLPKPEWSYESKRLYVAKSVHGLHIWFLTMKGMWWMDRYPDGTIVRNPFPAQAG